MMSEYGVEFYCRALRGGRQMDFPEWEEYGF